MFVYERVLSNGILIIFIVMIQRPSRKGDKRKWNF